MNLLKLSGLFILFFLIVACQKADNDMASFSAYPAVYNYVAFEEGEFKVFVKGATSFTEIVPSGSFSNAQSRISNEVTPLIDTILPFKNIAFLSENSIKFSKNQSSTASLLTTGYIKTGSIFGIGENSVSLPVFSLRAVNDLSKMNLPLFSSLCSFKLSNGSVGYSPFFSNIYTNSANTTEEVIAIGQQYNLTTGDTVAILLANLVYKKE